MHILIFSAFVTMASAFTTLDSTNTNIMNSLICKHLDQEAVSKMNEAVSQQNQLIAHCVGQVNQTIDQCVSCMHACGAQTVPIESHHISGISGSLQNVLHDLTHDPINHFSHGAISVAHDVGHAIEHVGHEISHGIQHIGHSISHIFGKRATDCEAKCTICQKVNSKNSDTVQRAVCGDSFSHQMASYSALVPKFTEISKAVNSRQCIQKIEFDPNSLGTNGGRVQYNTVYITSAVHGTAHRIKTPSALQLMNVEETAQQWTNSIYNLFMA